MHTDHESPTYTFDTTEGRIARWATTLGKCKFTVNDKNGKQMAYVDCLTRYPKNEEAYWRAVQVDVSEPFP